MGFDYLSLGLFVAGLAFASFIGILLTRSAIKAALKQELKTNAVEKIFETMGFKKFSPKDLNTKNLDDKGFDRFRILLYDIGRIYGQGAMTGNSAASKLTNDIAALTQLGQAMQGISPAAAAAKEQNTGTTPMDGVKP